ncbi:MAG: hypothetical protein MRERC_1c055 [Mycoplasmataceae bacterium RC_NB112A]|nr:MAG: hypothetical protein MRERC_1c055 [Mycoplasmataceae bacterium RC_NB112A]
MKEIKIFPSEIINNRWILKKKLTSGPFSGWKDC